MDGPLSCQLFTGKPASRRMHHSSSSGSRVVGVGLLVWGRVCIAAMEGKEQEGTDMRCKATGVSISVKFSVIEKIGTPVFAAGNGLLWVEHQPPAFSRQRMFIGGPPLAFESQRGKIRGDFRLLTQYPTPRDVSLQRQTRAKWQTPFFGQMALDTINHAHWQPKMSAA